jgi:alanine racemase
MADHHSWVDISLTALQYNFRTVLSFVQPEADVCAVVKSDAYGHGAGACSLALQQEGAKWFAVTTAEEGMALRGEGVTARILVLGGLWRGEEEAAIQYQLTPTIWNWNHLELLENAAEKLRITNTIPVHLKVNTGMNRLGVDLQDLDTLLEAIKSASHISLEGMFSHFASSEVVDAPQGELQLERFDQALQKAAALDLHPSLQHMANSAAIATRPKSWFNLVRPGISLYGYYLPFTSVITGRADPSLELPVKPVLSWKTRVIQVREVVPGQGVGYSSGYVTEFPTRVAVLSVGYADGLNHQLSSRGRVIIRNDYASIIGNISMNLTTVDVTGIPGVEVGDEVIIIGETAKRKIDAWEHANHASTIPYDVLCGISSRLPRRYVE